MVVEKWRRRRNTSKQMKLYGNIEYLCSHPLFGGNEVSTSFGILFRTDKSTNKKIKS